MVYCFTFKDSFLVEWRLFVSIILKQCSKVASARIIVIIHNKPSILWFLLHLFLANFSRGTVVPHRVPRGILDRVMKDCQRNGQSVPSYAGIYSKLFRLCGWLKAINDWPVVDVHHHLLSYFIFNTMAPVETHGLHYFIRNLGVG